MLDENKILLLISKKDSGEIEKYLSEAGYEVTLVCNTSDIEKHINKDIYSLVLAHIEFVTDELMLFANTVCVPVMCLVDEYKKEKNIDKLYSCGCVDYVTIPTHKHILLTRVKNQTEIKADEIRMHQAKDYLYDFAVTVSHDIKNQFTVSARLSEWLLDSGHEEIDEDSKIILTHLANFCNKTRYIIESIEDRTVNESRHRGGFVRRTVDYGVEP